MPQEPKKRHSRARQGKRRAAIRLGLNATILCPNCQSSILPHAVCPNCGFYKGHEVVKKKIKKLSEEKSSSAGKKQE